MKKYLNLNLYQLIFFLLKVIIFLLFLILIYLYLKEFLLICNLLYHLFYLIVIMFLFFYLLIINLNLICFIYYFKNSVLDFITNSKFIHLSNLKFNLIYSQIFLYYFPVFLFKYYFNQFHLYQLKIF